MDTSFGRNLYTYRRYIWQNAVNELRYRYAGTGMGIFWNILHPLVEILIYTLIFSLLFTRRGQGPLSRLSITVGILTWRCFSETIQRGSHALVENARYLRRVNIPAEIFIAKTALVYTLILAIYGLIFLPISVLLGNPISWKFLLLPVALLLLQGLAFGMTLSLANLQVLFPDIKEIISAFMPLWRWTLPLLYPEELLPAAIRRWLWLNPPHLFLRSIRQLVLEHQLPDQLHWLGSIFWLLVMAGTGIIVNHALRTDVKDAL